MRSAPPIGTGNAAVEGEARDAGFRRARREFHIENPRASLNAQTVDAQIVKAFAKTDDNTLDAAIAHQKIGADADDGDRNVGVETLEKIREIFFVSGCEQNLRRTAGAKPAEVRHANIGFKPAAQVRRRFMQSGREIRKDHAASPAANWPGSA